MRILGKGRGKQQKKMNLENANSKHALLELHLSKHDHKSLLFRRKRFKGVLSSSNRCWHLLENEGDNEVIFILYIGKKDRNGTKKGENLPKEGNFLEKKQVKNCT